jgi:hypothetical protein
VNCPWCGSRETGALSPSQFYCWRCFVEFSVGENTIDIYAVEEDGTLVSLGRAGAGDAADGAGAERVETQGVSAGR